MKAQTLRAFIDVHTWVGLIAGFALFIAFYTGAITVFTHELHDWDDLQAWHAPEDPMADAQPLVDGVMALEPRTRAGFNLQLPGKHGPHFMAYWYENRGAQTITHEFRLKQGQVVEGTDQSQLADFLYRLHYTAGLPKSWGIYVLGFVCVLYGVALVTGVIIYAPSFLRDLFALRAGRNLKRLWQDAHNVIGVLSLPFHVMFAWSGAILCIGTLLLVPFQYMVFDGKLPQIIEKDFDLLAVAPATHVPEPMLSLKELIARAQQAVPGFEVESLGYTQAGDANAQMYMYGTVPSRTVTSLVGIAMDANTGAVLRTIEPGNFSVGMRFYRGLVSLHFAEFGQMTVRWLYFILGMAGAFLFFSGNLVWIESRRNRRGAEQTRSSKVMAQITLGVALGCVAGVSAAFVISRLIPHAWAQHARDVEVAYYVVFFAAFVWALLRRPISAANELLLACAVLTAFIPVANVLGGGMTPWRSLTQHDWIPFIVDGFSLLFAWAFWRIATAGRARAKQGGPNSVWAATARA